MVWILGSKRHKGAPLCLFLIWVCSKSHQMEMVLLWTGQWCWCHQWTFNELSSEWIEQTSANMNGSASLFKHRTITKLAGWIWLKAGRILQVSSSEARFNALSIETLSIIATSSGVYSWNYKLVLCYLVCFLWGIFVYWQAPGELEGMFLLVWIPTCS